MKVITAFPCPTVGVFGEMMHACCGSPEYTDEWRCSRSLNCRSSLGLLRRRDMAVL